jgi:hypothetical protein
VWAATVISFALFVLVSLIWISLAYTSGNGIGWWQHNLQWWEGATAIGALSIGGWIVGRGEPDPGSATLGAVAMWALSTLGALLLVLPLLAHRVDTAAPAHLAKLPGPALWTTLVALTIGLATSMLTAGSASSTAALGTDRRSHPDGRHEAGERAATEPPATGTPRPRVGTHHSTYTKN